MSDLESTKGIPENLEDGLVVPKPVADILKTSSGVRRRARPVFSSITLDAGNPWNLPVRGLKATRSSNEVSEHSNDPLELKSRGIDVPEGVRNLLSKKDEEQGNEV